MRQLLPLCLSGVTIYGMWLAGEKRSLGWLVGLLNQIPWLIFIIVFRAWGLLPLTVALVVTYTRNLIRWRSEEHDAEILAFEEGAA